MSSRFSRVRLFETVYYGLQLSRVLCPWDSPGKNTGVGCHAFLQESNLCLLCLLHWQVGSLPLGPQQNLRLKAVLERVTLWQRIGGDENRIVEILLKTYLRIIWRRKDQIKMTFQDMMTLTHTIQAGRVCCTFGQVNKLW